MPISKPCAVTVSWEAEAAVTVRLADGKVENLSDAERKAITGAAQAAIDDDAMGPVDASGDDR